MRNLFVFTLILFLIIGCSSKDKERVTDEVGEFLGDDEIQLPDYPTDGAFILPHNPYNGSIKEYTWNDYTLAFKEPVNYPYGFDRDPAADLFPEKDNIVYISVADGEQASFIPQLVDDTYSCYCLINNSSNEIINLEISNSPVYLSAGLYSLMGKKEKPCNTEDSWVNLDRHIQVISYSKIQKNFIYVQVDGDDWNAEADENSFTLSRVTNYFNDVFNQALVYANPTQKSQNEYGLDYLMEIDMQNPSDEIADFLFNQVKQGMQTVTSNHQDDPKYHVVFAINKQRKKWSLDRCVDNTDYSITKECLGVYNFDPLNEDKNTLFYLISTKDGVYKQPTPVEIKISDNLSKFYFYSNSQKLPFTIGDVIYTDNGFPVIPMIDGVKGGTAAVSYSTSINGIFDGYLPYGSMVIAPRGIGANRQYTLMHELGHSFGLTDVEKYSLFLLEEDNEIKYGSYFNPEDQLYYDVTKTISFNNTYASSETNMMSWQLPVGRKIRYRETPIVCTGGTSYYQKNENGTNTYLGALERSLAYAISSYNLTNSGDRQWDCIRGECFNSSLSTDGRKMYWLQDGYCLETPNPTPITNEVELLDPNTSIEKILYQADKSKYISSIESFTVLYEKINSDKYLNKISDESN